jgi:hypothetical protein
LSQASSPPLEPEIRQFLEDMGMLQEREGLPPMAGRLLAWLMVCDPPLQTAAELARVLGASAGSISSTTRLLVQLGFVDRVAIPGQRSAAFRLCDCLGPEHLNRILVGTTEKRRLIERGVGLLEGKPGSGAQRLRDHLGFLRFIERELPTLIERWERERDA